MTLYDTTQRPGRIVVTGGCGFVGSNLAAALAARGHPVLVFDNFSRGGSADNASWLQRQHGDRISLQLGDIRDADAVSEAIVGAAAVLHLAGQVAVTSSVADPVEDFTINLVGTLTVLETIRRHSPQTALLFASTNKVYGRVLEPDAVFLQGMQYCPRREDLQDGVDEGTPLDLHSPYGCSKGAADQYVRDYARVYGLKTAVLRMSCIYGPRQYGTEDQGWIAHFILSALRSEPITIFGDGFQVRDALFIDDAVDAWLRVLDKVEARPGAIYNLGGGPDNALSLRELIGFMTTALELHPELRRAAWRPGDQPWYVSNIGALGRDLGWSPRTDLVTGLHALADWLRGQPGSAAEAPKIAEVLA